MNIRSLMCVLVPSLVFPVVAAGQSLTTDLIAYYDFEEAGLAGLLNRVPGVGTHHGAYLGDPGLIAGAGAGFAGNAAYPGAVAAQVTNRSVMLVGKALNVVKANTGSSAGKGHFQVMTLGSRGSGLDGGGSMGRNFTVSAWFRIVPDADNTSATGDIIRNFIFESVMEGATTAASYDISFGSNAGGVPATATPYLGQVAGTASVLAGNQWHHVLHAVSVEGSNSVLRAYVNGVQAATVTVATSAVDFRGINFGASRAGVRILDGMIDEVGVWRRALGAAEAAEVYQMGLAGKGLGTLLPRVVQLYWDTNGVSGGAGGESPGGAWGGWNWSSSAEGVGAVAGWESGAVAVFAAGSDATGGYAVDLGGVREAGEMRVRGGEVSLENGTLNLRGGEWVSGNVVIEGGRLRVAPGATLGLAVVGSSANMVTGAGVLEMAGSLHLDLGLAGLTAGGVVPLLGAGGVEYGTGFAVASTRGGFVKRGGAHLLADGGGTWIFSEAGGSLAYVEGSAGGGGGDSLLDLLVAYYDFEGAGAEGLGNKAPGVSGYGAMRVGYLAGLDDWGNGSGPGFAGDARFVSATGTSDRGTLLAGRALNLLDERNEAVRVPVGTAQLGPDFTVSVWHYLSPGNMNTSDRYFVFESADNYDVSWGTASQAASGGPLGQHNYRAYVGELPAAGLGPNGVAAGRWVHAVHVFASTGGTTTVTLYVDGVVVGSASAPTANVQFPAVLFGRQRGTDVNDRDWDGMLDEVALWRRALSAEEVGRLHGYGVDGIALVEPEDPMRRYWDINGAVAGAGGVAPAGVWAGNWSVDAAGGEATGDWLDGGTAVFSAGEDATGVFAVSLGGTREADGVWVREGEVTLAGGVLRLSGVSALQAAAGSRLTVQSGLEAGELRTRGDVVLASGVVVPGPLEVLGGVTRLGAESSFGGLVGRAGLEISGGLTLAPGVGASLSFGGELSGAGDVVVEGKGVQTLVRTRDGFGGGFVVRSGTLVLRGQLEQGGDTRVDGGTLVVAGGLSGGLVVGSGGCVSPGVDAEGVSMGTLEVGGSGVVTRIDGSLWLDLDVSNAAVGGVVNDLVRVNGDVVFGAGSMIRPRFVGGAPSTANVYTLCQVLGARTGLPVVDPVVQGKSRLLYSVVPGVEYPSDVMLAMDGEPAELQWVGDGVTNRWTANGDANWLMGAVRGPFLNPDAVTFGEGGDYGVPVEVTEAVYPSVVTVEAAGDFSWTGGGSVSGGGFAKRGAGVLTVLVPAYFSGRSEVAEGMVVVGDGTGAGGLGGLGDLSVAVGATVTYRQPGLVNLGRRVVGGGVLRQGGAGTLRTGMVGNDVDVVVDSGVFQVSEGGWTASYFTVPNRRIEVNAGGTLLTTGTHVLGGLGAVFHRPDVVVNAGGVWQLNAEQYMSAGDVKLNGGTILQTAANFRLQAGTLEVGSSAGGSVIARSGSGLLTLYGNAVMQVADGAAGVDLLISAPVAEDAAGRGLTKTGEGVLRLEGSNTFTGNVAIDSGVLELGTGGKLYNGAYNNTAVVTVNEGGIWRVVDFSYGGVGQLADYRQRRVLNGGVLEVTGPGHGSGQDFTVTPAGGTLRYSAVGETLVLSGNQNTDILLDGNLIVDAVGNIRVEGVSAGVAGVGGIVKTGAGSLVLANANTFSGSSVVNEGVLRLDAAGSLSFVVSGAAATSVSGLGSAVFDGTFLVDVAGVDAGVARSWRLAGVAVQEFGSTFRVVSGAGEFVRQGRQHRLVDGDRTWTFDEVGGVLSLKVAGAGGGFADWMGGVYPGEGNESVVGAGADPDGDGIPNAIEYVLGGDPRSKEVLAWPTLEVVSDHVVYRFRRSVRSKTEDTGVVVETGVDLGQWPASGVYVVGSSTGTSSPGVVVNSGAEGDEIVVTVPRDGSRVRFIRLRVTIGG